MNGSGLELFRKACGINGPLVLECRNDGRADSGPEHREFEQPFLVAGRDPRADLLLQGDEVSRLHAYFQAVGGRLYCRELSSRTGLAWGDQRGTADRGWLDPDQVVKIGGHRIRRIAGESGPGIAGSTHEPPDTPPFEWGDSPQIPRAALELPIRTGQADALWRIPKSVSLIGRSEGCDLTLSDDSVSRFHASFIRTPWGLWVVDLRSREGVRVEGVRVRWAWLDDGDAVRIGRFTFTVRCLDQTRELSRRDVPITAGALPVDATATAPGSRPDHPGRSLVIRPETALAPFMATSTTLDHTGAASSLWGADSALAWRSDLQGGPTPSAIWQQQMQLMESLHNNMLLMIQMFASMHREHLAKVRGELDRVEQLTRELSRLQAKLARDQPQEPGTTSPPASEPTRREDAVVGPGSMEAVLSGKDPRLATFELRNPRTSTGSETPSNGEVDASSTPESLSQDARGPQRASASAEAHSLLTERIATLQRERQGYWSRIVTQISKQ
jgi:pSer/pThr/pTyr-binding forkhead associated (FHA) protein